MVLNWKLDWMKLDRVVFFEKVWPEEATAANFDDFSSKSEKCHKKRFKHHIHSQNSIYSVKLEKLSKIYVQSVAHSVLMPVKRVMTEKFCLSCRTEAKHFWWNLHGTDNLLPYFYEFFNHLYILFACILLFIFLKIL